MNLILTRHGETEDNLKKIAQGWKDTILSKTGVEQAKKLAKRLKDEKIDVIYSSDLKRASKTAKEVNKYHNKKIILDKRIREINKGDNSGKFSFEVEKTHPERGVDWHKKRHPNGESFEDLRERVKDFLDYLSKKHTDETILIVTHGGTLLTFKNLFENKPFKERYKFENTCVNYVKKIGNSWKVLKLNCFKHLK